MHIDTQKEGHMNASKALALDERVRQLEVEVGRLHSILERLAHEHDSWCDYRRLLEHHAEGELTAAVASLEKRQYDRRARLMRSAVSKLIQQTARGTPAPSDEQLRDLRSRVQAIMGTRQ
jgi:hypothetical protein